MRTWNLDKGLLALVAVAGLALGSACAPVTHAKSVVVTYYYMPG